MTLTNISLESMEALMLQEPQVTIPVNHYFTDDGLYAREIVIPAGTLAVGHAHKQDFMEVFISGTLLVPTETEPVTIQAPKVGIGKPLVRKLGFAVTDCRWITFHRVPEGCNTVEKMEELIIHKSEAFLKFEKEKECQLLQQQ